MPAAEDPIANYGAFLVAEGHLATVRQKFLLSRSAQASLIGVAPHSLMLWEAGERTMHRPSAHRIGVWYQAILPTLEEFPEGAETEKLVPVSMAAEFLGMSAPRVMQKCESRQLACRDLGALGVYVYRRDIPALERRQHAAPNGDRLGPETSRPARTGKKRTG